MSGATYPGNWDPSPAFAVLTVIFQPPRCRMLQGCANGDCTHRRVAGPVYGCRDAGPATARGAAALPRSVATVERAGESDGGPRSGEDRDPALRRVAVCGAGPAARR